jgi:para-nitrobenzyl esterase
VQPRARKPLAAQMSDAWINFARTRNPHHAGLPKWQAFGAVDERTMVFDTRCEVRRNQDNETRKVMAHAAQPAAG